MIAESRDELVDRVMDSYCDWRQQCREARAAYEQLSAASGAERALAFAVYAAALDQEESAANEYAELLRRVAQAASPPAAATSIEYAMRGDR